MARDQRTTTAIRFPPAAHERLKIAAAEQDVSMNTLVVRAVEHFLGRMIPADEIVYIRPEETEDHMINARYDGEVG